MGTEGPLAPSKPGRLQSSGRRIFMAIWRPTELDFGTHDVKLSHVKTKAQSCSVHGTQAFKLEQSEAKVNKYGLLG